MDTENKRYLHFDSEGNLICIDSNSTSVQDGINKSIEVTSDLLLNGDLQHYKYNFQSDKVEIVDMQTLANNTEWKLIQEKINSETQSKILSQYSIFSQVNLLIENLNAGDNVSAAFKKFITFRDASLKEGKALKDKEYKRIYSK